MDLFILDREMKAIKIIDTFKSLIWTDRFQKCGDFELILPANSEYFQYLKADYYIWSDHSEHLMIIEDIVVTTETEEADSIMVTGRSLESILDRRIIWGLRTFSGNFQNEMKAMFDENLISPSIPERKIENFIFKESDDPFITGLKIETQYTGNTLY